MTKGFRAILLLLCLGCSAAALAAPKPRAKAPAAPAAPEAGWNLSHAREALRLFYGMPDGTGTAIIFSCMPRNGDVVIHVPLEAGKAKADQSQSVSLTIGGVKSSFAGRVVENQDGTLVLELTVPSRNPMFTSLGSPGGMRIETKGVAKIVSLKGIGVKLKPFLAGCRR